MVFVLLRFEGLDFVDNVRMHSFGFRLIQDKDYLDVGVEKINFGFQCQVLGLADFLNMDESSSGFSTLI